MLSIAKKKNGGPAEVYDRSQGGATEDFGPARPERLAARVYESLFHAIVTGKFARGQRLPSENLLAAQFDVSRPIVRQALDRLREEGLIESIRGSGSYVNEHPERAGGTAGPDGDPMERMNEILNGLEFRMVVETEAAFFAAQRRNAADIARMETALAGFGQALAKGEIPHHFDYAFHEAIGLATANPRFVAALKSLEYDVSHAVNLMRYLVHFEPLERGQKVLAEHVEIFELIKAGDGEAARRAMRNHLEHARIRMLNSRPGV